MLQVISYIIFPTFIHKVHITLAEHVSDLQILDKLTYLQDLGLDTRENRWEHDRFDWDSHVEKVSHEDCFKCKYRMDLHAHSNLVTILDPYLEHEE